jgi:hypothetical protein
MSLSRRSRANGLGSGGCRDSACRGSRILDRPGATMAVKGLQIERHRK